MELWQAVVVGGVVGGAIVAVAISSRRRLTQIALASGVVALVGGFILSPDCGDGSERVPGYVFAILLLAGWESGLAAGGTMRWLAGSGRFNGRRYE